MTRFEPQQAVEAALRLCKRVDGEAGIIAISPTGEIGWTHNSRHFAVALARAEAPDGAVFLSRGEFA